VPGTFAHFEIMKSAAPKIALFLALFALVGGLARFAYLRFQSGDVYPAYSTFRTDPIGSKALFESVNRLQPTKVRRNVQPLTLLEHNPGTTIVMLGVDAFGSNEEEEWLQKFATEGGRAIVVLDARGSQNRKVFPRAMGGTTNTNVFLKMSKPLFDLELRSPGLRDDTNRIEVQRVADEPTLPEAMPWFGRFAFATNDWETVYELNKRPVVVQKKFGLGRIVVIADSYPFSNEALRAARTPEFLLWALGNGAVVFDETHLGIQGGSGVAVLMREFRLHGLVAGCLVLAILWIWRNSTPLVPPPPLAAEGEQAMEGKTAREAVVHLLRRNLSGGDALRVGLEEWAKTSPPHYYWETVRLKEAQEIAKHAINVRQPNALAAAHRQLSELLFPKQH
jgi:hypothetical protein